MKAQPPKSERTRLLASTSLKPGPQFRRPPSDPGEKAIAAENQPSVRQWTKRQQALTASTFRKLGIEPQRVGGGRLWASQVLTVLGPHSFVEFAAVRTPGKVIWCNFELARQLGFEVPRANQLTPEFHEQLLAALSFRALTALDKDHEHETITMHADRYGGDGVRPSLGAGRAGFLPYGNLYVKGIGFTPLFKHDDPQDFAHSHGGVHLDDCLSEAVFGEVNENLFTRGSSRILAIIDQGKHVTAPTGRRIPVALVARAGAQLRPAHLLGNVVRRSGYLLDMFVNMARATGQLVSRPEKETGETIPDARATMLRIIDDHARTSAEAFRWRMIHGALSSSNMELSGAMLDLPTQSTQPRTAPIHCLEYAESVFGTEHIERAAKLMTAYRTVQRNTPPADRERCNVVLINFAGEMKAAYTRHLQLELLSAAGFKAAVAQQIQNDMPALASHFTELILRMIALKNPGTTRAWRSVVEHVSVLDVFHLLQRLPPIYFANPDADHTATILENLKPVFRGKRSEVVEKQLMAANLAGEFAVVYQDLMITCAGLANEHYGDLFRMRASITARAAFENEPLDLLYTRKLRRELNKAIADYQSNGNSEIIREAIDRRIGASLRSVEALLVQGNARRLSDGCVELQMRTIDGVNYSVKAWNNEQQTRRLHVSIPLEHQGNLYTSSVRNLPRLTDRQIQSLRYRYTTDEWKSSGEAVASLTHDELEGSLVIFDELDTFPLVGRIEGYFYLGGNGRKRLKDLTPRLGGYSFAIPDQWELTKLTHVPELAGKLAIRRSVNGLD